MKALFHLEENSSQNTHQTKIITVQSCWCTPEQISSAMYCIGWRGAFAGAAVSKLSKALLSALASNEMHIKRTACLDVGHNLCAKWKCITENVLQQKITFLNNFGFISKGL